MNPKDQMNLIHTAACLARDCSTLIRCLAELDELRAMASAGTIGTGVVSEAESHIKRLRRQIVRNSSMLAPDDPASVG